MTNQLRFRTISPQEADTLRNPSGHGYGAKYRRLLEILKRGEIVLLPVQGQVKAFRTMIYTMAKRAGFKLSARLSPDKQNYILERID